MKFKFSLSSKVRTDGTQELLMMASLRVGSKVTKMRAKSEVFISSKYFDGECGIKDLSRKLLATPEVTYHKEQLTRLKALMKYVEDELAATDKSELTAQWLNAAVNRYYRPEVATERKSFVDLANEYMEKKMLSEGYKRSFRVMVRDVARYERFIRATDKGRKDFEFNVDRVTRNDIEDFADYIRAESGLADEYPALYKKLLSEYPIGIKPGKNGRLIEQRGNNTIHGIMKKLRAFFAWLYETDKTTNRPFDGVKIVPEQYGTPIYITKEEREIIARAAMPSKHLETQRDIFVFQCLIGCRVGDLIKLTEKNIINGILTYTPHKTKDESSSFAARVPLVEKARVLIEKYRGADKFGRLFPFISQPKYNDAIKDIFTAAGITRPVEVRNSLTGENEMKPINAVASSHLARRTFVGNLYFQIKDPAIIGKMSGHVEGSKAFQRYRNIADEILSDAIRYIE